MRLLHLLPTLLLVACPAPPDSGAPPAGDTDTDTDTDADTDADTDPGAFDGVYEGALVVELSERTVGVEGRCLGAMTVTIDHEAEPPVTGTGACQIEEGPAGKIVPPLGFSLHGALIGGGSVGGEVVADAGGFEASSAWTATLGEGVTVLESAWSGEIWYYHYVIDYEAQLEAR